MSKKSGPGNHEEVSVRKRYTAAALQREAALCCPVDYDAQYLEVIPRDVLERDYGCGDPSRYVEEGDIVLDLGSGGGKICFIAAQLTGPKGKVIGVEMNEAMLTLARGAAPIVARQIGFENVRFVRGRIQDLGLDLDRLEIWLRQRPVRTIEDLVHLEREAQQIRREFPLVADQSVDLVVSNCVLNLVPDDDKSRLIREIFRVLRPGGRIAISDIVSNEPVPDHLKDDPDLWSGCISGAFHERDLLERLEQAGFYGITIDKWAEEPFALIEGIEFRSVTVTARKISEGPHRDVKQAVIYRGPWKRVEDEAGRTLVRGERTPVTSQSYRLLTAEPYAGSVVPIPPREAIAEDQLKPIDRARASLQQPRETMGEDCIEPSSENACSPGETCC